MQLLMMRQRPGGMFGSGMPMQQPAMQPAPTQGQLPPTDPAQQPDQRQHLDPVFTQQFTMPPPQPQGGMFGNGKFGIGQALVAALNGYLAGTGNPVGMANIQMMQQMALRKQQRQQELDDYNRKRADDRSDFTFEQDYKAAHPAHVNNDTVADYNFWKSVLPPDQFQQYVANKVNPPQLMEVPGVGIVSVPRMAPQQGVPSAPVGKLTPLGAGGPTPSASGGFPY
jgi:hypothetical protein